ncbi:hypothetical protein BH24ACT3_BH24ACT3_08120 [soil metagenome]
MPRATATDVLLALLGAPAPALDGTALSDRLTEAGRPTGPAHLLAHLLELEGSGHVSVVRSPSYRFALTPKGETAAYELGPGQPIDVVLVMVDLVGYVSYTAANGDSAAHLVAQRLQQVGDEELRARGGWLVKALGDGFLGAIEPTADAAALARSVAERCQDSAGDSGRDGERWQLRAAAHHGRPICHRRDRFGADVNLVARLCDAARPGELLVSTGTDGEEGAATESLAVRGLPEPVPVSRRALA